MVEAFADPAGVLIVDETGDLKKGFRTVGTQRQYTGTAGRTENSQIAVYLTYATPAGHALIDRALYLPRSWTDDPGRLHSARVPDEVGFATKPAVAVQMIERALDAGVPAAFVAGDEVYGNDLGLRTALAVRGVGYVLAAACNRIITTADRARHQIACLASSLPARSWQRLSAGRGTKGHRFYSWALVTIVEQDLPGCHWLLLRRNDSTGELAYYRCHSTRPVPLATLVGVAGQRWKIEEAFQAAKGQAGLDQHQVRTWTSWHPLDRAGHARHGVLAVTRARHTQHRPTEPGLVPVSLAELRRLFDKLTTTTTTTEQNRTSSIWRRKHQERARQYHYHRRSAHL